MDADIAAAGGPLAGEGLACELLWTGADGPKSVASFVAPFRSRTADTSVARGSVRVPDAKLWSAETPNLYTLVVTMPGAKGEAEALRLRVGFRTVEVRQGRLLLNGSELTIRGVNRHEHHPTKGHVVTPESMLEAIRLSSHASFSFFFHVFSFVGSYYFILFGLLYFYIIV